ncbi:MAG: ABC transporter permease subunit [Christensenellales bacterium]
MRGFYIYIYIWIVVPGITGIFNMLLMRNFFESIPKEIVDSAKSDGASNMKIFRRIVCPLAKSTIMLVVLFTFTGSWNNLVWPQLLLSGEISYWNTVTVALTAIRAEAAGALPVSLWLPAYSRLFR